MKTIPIFLLLFFIRILRISHTDLQNVILFLCIISVIYRHLLFISIFVLCNHDFVGNANTWSILLHIIKLTEWIFSRKVGCRPQTSVSKSSSVHGCCLSKIPIVCEWNFKNKKWATAISWIKQRKLCVKWWFPSDYSICV